MEGGGVDVGEVEVEEVAVLEDGAVGEVADGGLE